ncbi:hypothetical protein Absy_100_074 [Acetobacter syzygii]|nr:hypothetical protein Absy_100_074 [Acetobacter syzygii]
METVRIYAPVKMEHKKPPKAKEKLGGCTRTRTLDPLIKSQLLYQLSYAPLQPIGLKLGSFTTPF